MRPPGLPVAASLLALAACTNPNPAWLVTETDPGSSGSGGTSSISTTAPGTTVDPTSSSTGDPTTGGTLSTTGDPVTSAPVTTGPDTTTTGDPSSTTDAPACGFPASDDLDLTYTTSLAPGCDPLVPRQAHVEVLGKVGANQWKFNVCGSELNCRDPNVACDDGEHIIFTFDGPPELVPTFVPGECHQMHALARGPDPQDPQSCKLRLLRIAHTRFLPYATHYVGAVHVPGTAALPVMGEWLGLPGFSLASKLVEQCADDLNCMPAAGAYAFEVFWGNPAVQHIVGEGETFSDKLIVADGQQNQIEIDGAFTNLRSRIQLAQMCGEGQEFKWVWLAAIPGP